MDFLSRFSIISSLLVALASCQSATSATSGACAYTTLPNPPVYPDGNFTSPTNQDTQIYSDGSLITISWTTKYDSVNLYFITGEDYGNPTTIALYYSELSIPYTFDVANFCVPYSFRAVDANGNSTEQQLGGFYTGQFWIKSNGESSSSSRSSVTQSSTTLSGTTSLVTSSQAVTSSQSLASSTSNPMSSGVIQKSNQSSVDIGVGVGVGVGVGLVLSAAAVFYWRRYHRHMKEKYSQGSQPPSGAGMHTYYGSSGAPSDRGFSQGDMSQWSAQAAMKSPVEVPSGITGPTELTGDLPAI